VQLKGVLQRIVRDERILTSNSKAIQQLILRKAVQFVQKEVKNLETREERIEKMKELIQGGYDTINEAVDLIEKELEYTPQELLGFAMYPDRVTGLLTTLATIAFGLLSSKFA
jgi:predicted HTH domain antitoxin